jgi:nicotinamide-nucleotide amidase
MMNDDLISLRRDRLAEQLMRQGLLLAVAESCTGGWLAKVCTDVSGSSSWFDRGFVTYSNRAKQQMLGVSEQTLQAHGAVSEAVVIEMVSGVLQQSDAHVAVSISGVAGPGGGTEEKPVGTVWLAWKRRTLPVIASCCHFDGDRNDVRSQAVERALQGLLDLV